MAAAAGDTVTVPVEMVTVAVAGALVPPAPEQVNAYVVLAVRAPVLAVPLAAFVPLQPTEAVHEVALVELQVNVAVPPLATLVGLADSAAVGTTLAATVTVAVASALVPPGPVHFNAYVVLAVRAPVLAVPLAAFVPLQPPEAVHEVALVELQVNVDVPPLATLVGLADSAAVGRAMAVTVTVALAGALVPPAPEQVNAYVVLAVRAPVLTVPLVVLVPLQPPEAVHEVALVELHVKLAAPPLSTTVVDALSTAVGAGGTGVAGVDPEPPQATNANAAALVNAVIKNRIRPSLASSIRYI
jgi:hypothetical protein